MKLCNRSNSLLAVIAPGVCTGDLFCFFHALVDTCKAWRTFIKSRAAGSETFPPTLINFMTFTLSGGNSYTMRIVISKIFWTHLILPWICLAQSPPFFWSSCFWRQNVQSFCSIIQNVQSFCLPGWLWLQGGQKGWQSPVLKKGVVIFLHVFE